MEEHYAQRGQKPARAGPSTQYFSLGDESVPERVGEPQLQARVQRHVMEDLGTVCPFVQILDAPVVQLVGNVADALRILDRPIAEQVIEVPTISCSSCPSRSPIPVPQSAEQLVEVPTVLSPFHGADRRHSSSAGSWHAECSRFSPRTGFNSGFFFFGTHF